MWHGFKVWMQKIDWLLMLIVFLLISFSLAILYSLNIGQDFNFSNLFVRQIIFAIIGFLIAIFLSKADFNWLKNYYKLILIITVFLLLLVLFFADPIRGITGWLEIGGQTFQPAELAKIAAIVFLAYYFSDAEKDFFQVRHILITGIVISAISFLVALQPDLGAAFIIFATWLTLLLFTRTPKKYFFILALVLIVLAVGMWFFALADYQKARLTTFINPQSDLLGQGYNVQQSIIAVGSGQVLGRGLGGGSQSQLEFLPEQYSDFIFAVLAESLGLWGAWLVIFLYLALFIRLAVLVRNSGSPFGTWLVLGILIYLAWQVIINIAMTIGIAPVTGITLPFISYGGSSLLISFFSLGLVLSVVAKRREKLFVN